MPQKKKDKKKKKRWGWETERQGISSGSGTCKYSGHGAGKSSGHGREKIRQVLSSDEENMNMDSFSDDSSICSISFDGEEEVTKGYSEKAITLMEELTDRRSSIRIRSFKKLIGLFKKYILYDFSLEYQETLMTYLLSSIRKGRGKEVRVACRVFTLLVVSLGVELGNIHSSIWTLFETYIRNVAKSISSRTAVTELLGLICFTGDQEHDEVLQSLELLAQIWKQGLVKQYIDEVTQQSSLENKVIKTVLRTEELTIQALESWCLICTVAPQTIVERQMSMHQSYLIQLLDHDSLEIRAAAGEALALGYSFNWNLSNTESDYSYNKKTSVTSLPSSADLDLDWLIQKVKKLSKDGNRHRSKKERAKQRSIFRDILRTFENHVEPNEFMQISKNRFEFYGWAHIIQMAAFRRCLDRGLQFHMIRNEFLISVFDLTYFEPIFEEKDYGMGKKIRHLENQNRERMQDMYIANERKKKNLLMHQHDGFVD